MALQDRQDKMALQGRKVLPDNPVLVILPVFQELGVLLDLKETTGLKESKKMRVTRELLASKVMKDQREQGDPGVRLECVGRQENLENADVLGNKIHKE